MKKSTLILLTIGTTVVLYTAETPKAVTVAPKAAPARSSALKAEALSRSLLQASKGILSKVATKQDYTAELAVLLNTRKDIEKEKLRTVAVLGQQYASLKEKKAPTEVLAHLDEQRRGLVARFNETDRLLKMIAENQDKPALTEKVSELVSFLEPPQNIKDTTVQLNRRSAKEGQKNSEKKLSRKPEKK